MTAITFSTENQGRYKTALATFTEHLKAFNKRMEQRYTARGSDPQWYADNLMTVAAEDLEDSFKIFRAAVVKICSDAMPETRLKTMTAEQLYTVNQEISFYRSSNKQSAYAVPSAVLETILRPLFEADVDITPLRPLLADEIVVPALSECQRMKDEIEATCEGLKAVEKNFTFNACMRSDGMSRPSLVYAPEYLSYSVLNPLYEIGVAVLSREGEEQ